MSAAALRTIRTLHTVIWAAMAAIIVALPVLAWRRQFGAALVVIAIVALEVGVLLANHWRCPLTDLAARHTSARADNFDIYLPAWLARHNKTLFGGLYVAGIVITLVRWRG